MIFFCSLERIDRWQPQLEHVQRAKLTSSTALQSGFQAPRQKVRRNLAPAAVQEAKHSKVAHSHEQPVLLELPRLTFGGQAHRSLC
jgi:hypothetical protein